MIGFDGDRHHAERLSEALGRVLRVFPEHLAHARPPTSFEPEEIAKNHHFDAMVRAHKKDRLALPVQALLWTGAPYHNFERMHARRLAWFVPSFLAAWLARAEGAGGERLLPGDIARIVESTMGVEGHDALWSEEEAATLDTFFQAALDAALATPLPPARADLVERPLKDGLHVWSRHAPSVPLEVLRCARALIVPTEPLVLAWVGRRDALALDHLLEAVFDPTTPAKRYLAHEPVADRLAEAFFAGRGERAVRLSKAENHVRRWITRREEQWP